MADGSRTGPAAACAPPTKAELRAAALAARAALPAARRQAYSATIVEALDRWLRARIPATAPIALYASIRDEVDLAALAARCAARGQPVVYPRIAGDVLTFHRVTSIAAFGPGPFGIREPLATAPQVPAGELGAVIVPLIAVDAAGYRIGWGRGFYDHTFASVHPLPPLLGAAFACQLVARVPADAHDVPVHLVFTEAGAAGGPGWPAPSSGDGS